MSVESFERARVQLEHVARKVFQNARERAFILENGEDARDID